MHDRSGGEGRGGLRSPILPIPPPPPDHPGIHNYQLTNVEKSLWSVIVALIYYYFNSLTHH
jgi:hypothetical protein